jgi:hypothetical protein
MSHKKRITVESTIGERPIDATGSAIGVIRMDPTQSYIHIPELLQSFIDEANIGAWEKIKARIDYTYTNLDQALQALNDETNFGEKLRLQVKKRKKLFFKPNLVNPNGIDPLTRGEGMGSPACTPWAFVAALMRWFHDKLEISYHEMALGEAGTGLTTAARAMSLLFMGGKKVTTEVVIEGKIGNFYGGWGFYFTRKYLAETHPRDHKDDPMNGYEESLTGEYLPPGRATDRLMVYDLNRLFDVPSKGRKVEVPDGANFKEITLHKVIVGGDPEDPEDLRNYPGCVLVNVPRLKVHTQALFTNAIKNLGIGLYPMEVAHEDNPKSTRWKYSFPYKPGPTLKSEIPHSVWFAEVDDETGLPRRDQDGKYIVTKTAGLSGTMVDIVKAVQNQSVFSLHVVDAIETVNIRHDGFPESVKVPEGYVFASLDPVALDLLCARYLFKTMPMAEARMAQKKKNLPEDFIQRVPLPQADGHNIVTREGFDNPISRYHLFDYAAERGLGQQGYYVAGRDEVNKYPLASLEGHLGRIEGRKFTELITSTLYYCSSKVLWDLQTTILNFARANDRLTGSSYFKLFMDAFDEDRDGAIDYDEMGTKGFWHPFMRILANSWYPRGTEPYGYLQAAFQTASRSLQFSNVKWNSQGHDFVKELLLVRACAVAFQMSQLEEENKDPFFPAMTWGKGKWPSIQLAYYAFMGVLIYGLQFPRKVNLTSLYGQAFQYADKKKNGGHYTGGIGLKSDLEAANSYIKAVSEGAVPLDFILYLPRGFGKMNGTPIPNIEETEEPDKLFTARFNNGREVW